MKQLICDHSTGSGWLAEDGYLVHLWIPGSVCACLCACVCWLGLTQGQTTSCVGLAHRNLFPSGAGGCTAEIQVPGAKASLQSAGGTFPYHSVCADIWVLVSSSCKDTSYVLRTVSYNGYLWIGTHTHTHTPLSPQWQVCVLTGWVHLQTSHSCPSPTPVHLSFWAGAECIGPCPRDLVPCCLHFMSVCAVVASQRWADPRTSRGPTGFQQKPSKRLGACGQQGNRAALPPGGLLAKHSCAPKSIQERRVGTQEQGHTKER